MADFYSNFRMTYIIKKGSIRALYPLLIKPGWKTVFYRVHKNKTVHDSEMFFSGHAK